jgi:ABC-type protease/lipase transport system fused ATPase/permease subunit
MSVRAPAPEGEAMCGADLLLCFAILNELLTRKPLCAANREAIDAMRQAEAAVRNAEASMQWE